jgi:hypothetical protein
MPDGQTGNPPTGRQLLLLTSVALVAASLVTLTVVLPAEFGKDPTGIGGVLGLTGLSQQEHGAGAELAVFHDKPFRTDVVDVPLFPKGGGGPSRLEYKVRMDAGATFVYSWQVQGGTEKGVYYDLHSETDGPDVKVVEFKQGEASVSSGSLVAPVAGLHGWYWENRSGNLIVIQLKTAGFYELVPPGDVGNKTGIVPNAGADEAQKQSSSQEQVQ